MKKTYIFFLAILLSGVGLIAQPQLTWRFANPEIIRQETTDRLEFDLQVKASENGTYLYSGQYILRFNNAAFFTSSLNTTVIRSGISDQYSNDLGSYKYTITKNNTGVAPNIVINVALSPSEVAILQEEPSSAWSAELTTEWQTFTRLRIRINDPSLLAGISFVEASMNGQISYHSGVGVTTNYANPNLYETLSLDLLNLGRIYAESYGWSQVGENQIDWSTPVNTTVFDGNAGITQTDLTAALANNLNIMPGASLNIGSNKWLTVNGTLSSPDADALVIADQASLLHQTAGLEASIKRNLSGGSINPTTHRYHLVSVPMHESSVFNAGDLFTGVHLWEMNIADQAWQKITSATQAIDNQEGYLLWHDGVSHELSFAGVLNADNVALPSHAIGINGDGSSYRLIPNPYPSAMQWNTPAGYDAAVYFFDAATANYKTFADGVPSPAIVPYGQSFFIKTTNPGGTAPAITIAANTRLHHQQAFYKSDATFTSLLHIQASTSFSEDETFIRFATDASAAFDREKDALKLFGFGDAPQLYTFGDNQYFAINTLEASNEAIIVPLHFSMTTDGLVSLNVSGLSSFENKASIYLEDIFLNEMVDLHEQQQYAFDHQTLNPSHRFNLHFYGVLGDQELPVEKWKVWSYNQYVYINIPHGEETSVMVEMFDMTGRMIYGKQHAVNSPIIVYGGQLPQMVLVKITSAKRSLNQVLFIQ